MSYQSTQAVQAIFGYKDISEIIFHIESLTLRNNSMNISSILHEEFFLYPPSRALSFQ